MSRRTVLPIIMRFLASAIIVGGLSVCIARLEERRPIVELERAGATVVIDFDGLVRSVSFCDPSATDRHLKHIAQLETVTTITLSRSSVTSEGISLLAELPQLRSLDISETPDAAGSLAVAAKFPALCTLQLRRCPWMNDAEFAAVRGESRIENLMLVDVPVTDAGLVHVRQFPRLVQLGLDDCEQLTDEGLKQLSFLRELKELSLDRCDRITPTGLEQLEVLTNLQMLGMRGVPIDRDDLRRLARRLHGTSVNVDQIVIPEIQPLIQRGARVGLDDDYEVVWIELDNLASQSGVVSPYSLEGSPVEQVEPWRMETAELLDLGDESLEDLRLVPTLQALFLRDIDVTDAGLSQLTQLPELEWLVLDRVGISDQGLPALAAMPNLRRLWLRNVAVTGTGLASLQSAPALTELSLYSHRLTPAGMEQIERLPQIRTLVIGSRLPEGSGRHLAALPALEELAVVSATLPADEIEQLCQAPSLKRLQLIDSRLAPDALQRIGRIAKLDELHLGQCDFDPRDLGLVMQQRPELKVTGVPDAFRDRPAMFADDRQLLSGIPPLLPRAPASVH